MFRFLVVLLTILKFSSEVFLPNEDVSPGFAVRITQRTLDHGVEKATEALSHLLGNVVFPDIEQPLLLGNNVKLRRTHLRRCDIPQMRLRFVPNRDRSSNSPSHNPLFNTNGLNDSFRSNYSLVPNIRRIRTERGAGALWFDESFNPGNTNAGNGGLSVSITGVNVDIESYAEVQLLFSSSEDRFNFYFTVRDASLNLTTYVGEKNGMFKLSSVECLAQGDVRVDYNGTVSQTLQNYLRDSAFLQAVLFGQACSELTNRLQEAFGGNIPQSMTNQLSFFPSLTLDYGLTEAPIFRENYLETRHVGTFQPTNNFQNWPFTAKPVVDLEDASRMIYLFLSDYTLNTLWQSLYLGNHLKWNINQRDVDNLRHNPENVRYFAPFRDFLNQLSPNAPVEIQITVKSPPYEVFKIEGRKLTINLEAYTTFFKSDPVHTKLLELENVVNCETEVVVTSRKLSYDLQRLDVTSRVVSAASDVPAQELSANLDSVTIPTFKGILRDIGREGFTLPDISHVVNITNLHVFEDTSGVLVVGTDYDVNPRGALMY